MRYTAQQESELITKAQSGDRKAAGLLVESLMGLIHREARTQSRRCSEPLDDLVQTASMGVLDAIRRFDPSRGCRLITVALARIRTALRPVVRLSHSQDRREMPLEYADEPCDDTPDPCDDIDTKSIHSEVTSAMAACLTPREHMILRRATSVRSESSADIGASVGLSRETVRLDYESAVNKVRRALSVPPAVSSF
jgi:RNA polymerase sigma factor (sigma-70 family)